MFTQSKGLLKWDKYHLTFKPDRIFQKTITLGSVSGNFSYEKLLVEVEKKLSELISKLPSGILVTFDGTDHYKLTNEVYEQVCKATKLIPQRAIMGANFLNFRAHEIYTINGNKIDETFVKWDKEKNKLD